MASDQLVINGISLNESHNAWRCFSLVPLWTPSSYRTGNLVLPGASGKRPYPYRIDEGHYSIQMFVQGWIDYNGTSYTDWAIGLQTNIAFLNSLKTPPTPPASTYAATLTLPDGTTTRTANVQVVSLDFSDDVSPMLRAVLELVVPAGRFT